MMRFTSVIVGMMLVTTFATAQVVVGSASSYFSETTKDFGASPRGPLHVHPFKITNTTNETMQLSAPRASCGCVTASTTKYTLAPGESTTIVATMDSKRVPVSNIPKTVNVFVNVQVGNRIQEVQLSVTSTARDDLVISPEMLNFGSVRKGQGGTVTTKLTYYSDANWKITEAVSNGIYVKATVKELPAVVGISGKSYEVTATLDTDCPVGNWTADIWLKTSAPGIVKVRLPVSVIVMNPIEVRPGEVTFGNVIADASSDVNISLNANEAFKILEIKGADGELEVSKPSAVARPTHNLKLTLKAKKAGAYTKSIEVITDHPEQKTLTIPVTGQVIAK